MGFLNIKEGPHSASQVGFIRHWLFPSVVIYLPTTVIVVAVLALDTTVLIVAVQVQEPVSVVAAVTLYVLVDWLACSVSSFKN